MVRSTSKERLERVIRAATPVFADRGFRRTQMADVAAEIGVSPGNLYNYVESKEALYHACLVAASPAAEMSDPSVPGLPITTPAPGATVAVVTEGMRWLRRTGPLRHALLVDDPEDVASELEGIIGDFYDRTHATRIFQALVERSAPDLPELYEAFFVRTRRPALSGLTAYLERRIASGHLRPVPDVAAAARLINETQAWFARHRGGDQDAKDIDDGAARSTVIDMLVAALLPR